jgi:hypothetical protein
MIIGDDDDDHDDDSCYDDDVVVHDNGDLSLFIDESSLSPNLGSSSNLTLNSNSEDYKGISG